MPTLVPSSEDTQVYEFCILYPYPLNQKEEHELLKEMEALFNEAGAKQIAKDSWGRRGLAYPVGGFAEGVFLVYHLEMDPARVKELDQQLRILKGVLRHLIIKPPKHYQIVKYSEAFEQWLKDRETVEQQRSRAQEERVKEQVARKAKRQAKVATERKKTQPAETPMQAADLTQKIDELISDDSIDNL